MNTTPTNRHSRLNALAAQVPDKLRPRQGYTTTPTTRNGDGFHRGGGKPTDCPGQWVLIPGAKLPPRAFEIHENERRRFHRLCYAVLLEENALARVEQLAHNIFDATFGAEERKFEAEIDAGQVEVARLSADRAKFEADLERTPATILTEAPEPKMPSWFSLRWWGFLLCGVCFCLSATGAISNIVIRLLPETQALWPAVAVSGVWVLLAVAAKLGLRAVRSPLREILHWAIAAIGICGAVVWLAGIVTGYAMELNVNDLATSGVLSRSKVLPLLGQLAAEFAVGFACLTGMLSLVSHRCQTVPNPDRQVLSRRLAELNTELDKTLRELANPRGNLTELNASREALVAEGVAIVHLRKEEAALLAELQRRRMENQRLLSQFTA